MSRTRPIIFNKNIIREILYVNPTGKHTGWEPAGQYALLSILSDEAAVIKFPTIETDIKKVRFFSETEVSVNTEPIRDIARTELCRRRLQAWCKKP